MPLNKETKPNPLSLSLSLSLSCFRDDCGVKCCGQKINFRIKRNKGIALYLRNVTSIYIFCLIWYTPGQSGPGSDGNEGVLRIP